MWFDDYGNYDQYDNKSEEQWQMDTEQSGYDYVPISYAEYCKQIELLLKNFKLFYNPTDPAHCHRNEQTSVISHLISQFVNVHWRNEFTEFQYPIAQRKLFGAYTLENPPNN